MRVFATRRITGPPATAAIGGDPSGPCQLHVHHPVDRRVRASSSASCHGSNHHIQEGVSQEPCQVLEPTIRTAYTYLQQIRVVRLSQQSPWNDPYSASDTILLALQQTVSLYIDLVPHVNQDLTSGGIRCSHLSRLPSQVGMQLLTPPPPGGCCRTRHGILHQDADSNGYICQKCHLRCSCHEHSLPSG